MLYREIFIPCNVRLIDYTETNTNNVNFEPLGHEPTIVTLLMTLQIVTRKPITPNLFETPDPLTLNRKLCMLAPGIKDPKTIYPQPCALSL